MSKFEAEMQGIEGYKVGGRPPWPPPGLISQNCTLAKTSIGLTIFTQLKKIWMYSDQSL